MSRQHGEPVSSYVLRRKTWWRQVQQLDPHMAVSEGILAEQILQNAGLTEGQKLMIRTTLRGKMEVDLVGDELLDQHPRLHEREPSWQLQRIMAIQGQGLPPQSLPCR